MRLFTAINFDSETLAHIQTVQDRLRRLSTGRFTHAGNLHLTLNFLGEVPETHLGLACEAMDGVALPKLLLQFTHVGRFRRTGGDVWWIGLAPNVELETLQEALAGYLRDAGFTLDKRRYTPHLTLARQVRMEQPVDLGALMGVAFEMHVDTVHLMSSEQIQGKRIYTSLHRIGKTGA